MKALEHIVYATPQDVLQFLIAGSYPLLTTGQIDECEQFAVKYLLDSYLSKFNSLDKSQAAERDIKTFQKWQRSERLCYDTNVRLAYPPSTSLTAKLLAEMRRNIGKLLGKIPGDYQMQGGFSGGATVDTRRGLHFTEKVWGAISCGENNIIDACYAVGRLSPTATLVPYGYCRATQVPKNDSINRMIAIEPTASVYMQKAIGSLIRKRLKRVGVDLDDQTINQRSAQKAYSDHLATIDLSSASDSMSFELVRQVIPDDWFRELVKHRSPCMRYLGRDILLQKFSSMGNGYTFELESLIFWALCKSVCSNGHINVYGDDIIVAQSDASRVIAALTMIGFQVNEEKSFVSGSFFESCGEHFYKGVGVTPCYQKELPSDLASGMRMHNRLVRWALKGPTSRFDIIRPACQHILRCFGHRDLAIPYGVQRDDGWLVNTDSPFLSVDVNGDFYCRVAVQAQAVRRIPVKLQDIAYQYKLVHPHHLNEHPSGRPGKPGSLVVRERKVVIWKTSTVG